MTSAEEIHLSAVYCCLLLLIAVYCSKLQQPHKLENSDRTVFNGHVSVHGSYLNPQEDEPQTLEV